MESRARVLIWCFALSVALLIIWFVFYLLIGDWGYSVHSKMFDELTRRDYELINYCGMAVMKLFVFVVFLIPYLAIRLVLRAKA
ncbi:MAG: DUF6868 family protein [Planctomycetota bacterium]